MGERTHGTRAKGSGAGEQHHVDMLIEHFFRASRAGIEAYFSHAG